MFIIDQSPTYKWTVKFSGVDENGKQKSQAFTAIFNRIPQSRIEEIVKAEGVTDKDIVREVMSGWEDIKTASGNDVEFTSANLELLIDNPGLAAAIVTEFMLSITGSKRKN